MSGWSREGLKARGKEALRHNYWKSVFVAFVLGVVVLGCVLMLLVSVANAGSLAYEMARWEMGWMR